MAFLADHLGEAAALGAATCWAFTSLAFAGACRRIGPTAVNVIRILLAGLLVLLIHRGVVGAWLPAADAASIQLLALSGLIGFAIGDQLAFAAFVDVGPRLATLLMTLTPPAAAAFAWPVLDEPLGLTSLAGMAVTIGGIAWVANERPDPTAGRPHPHRIRGLICAALAAICQAAGLILSKLGIGHGRLPNSDHLDPWSASLVRLTFGALAICALAAIRRAGRSATAAGAQAPIGVRDNVDANLDSSHRSLPQPLARNWTTAHQRARAIVLLTIGALLGPVVGVWCSLVAVDRAEAGIAATLMAMTPVIILPFAVWIDRDRLSWRAVLGAIIAVAGVAILMLANGDRG